MEGPIPKLKLMGLLTASAMFLQLISLSSTWFILENSNFSIRGISSSYEIDLIVSDCATYQTFDSYLCFCGSNCEALIEINKTGWISVMLIIISVNCFFAEIFNIRRKIWKCEGVVLQPSFIDNDCFIVIGTFLLNAAALYWFWVILKYRNLVMLVGGINSMIIACVLHIFSSMYYFVKIRAETRNR